MASLVTAICHVSLPNGSTDLTEISISVVHHLNRKLHSDKSDHAPLIKMGKGRADKLCLGKTSIVKLYNFQSGIFVMLHISIYYLST